jgi:hypothetical protein
VLHTFSDGKGGQTITDTGALTKKRMETVDEEIFAAEQKFVASAVKRASPSSSGSTPRACTCGRA